MRSFDLVQGVPAVDVEAKGKLSVRVVVVDVVDKAVEIEAVGVVDKAVVVDVEATVVLKVRVVDKVAEAVVVDVAANGLVVGHATVDTRVVGSVVDDKPEVVEIVATVVDLDATVVLKMRVVDRVVEVVANWLPIALVVANGEVGKAVEVVATVEEAHGC